MMWSGAVTATGCRVVVEATSSVRLAVDTNPLLTVPTFYGPVTPSNGVASFTLTSLSPNTSYYYSLENPTIGEIGSFKTFPILGESADYMWAAGSCAGHVQGGHTNNGVSNHPVFDTIRLRNPLFMAHLGDLHYRNIDTNDVSAFRTAYHDVLATARQGSLYRAVPIIYTWDDHDFGADGSYSGSASKPAAQQVYRERVPHYPLPASNAIYHSFGCGRVLYVVADVRSDRSANTDTDGPSKTMLGTAQKAWLETLLENPGFDAQWFVWLMPSQWMGTAIDTWTSYATERDELVELFGDTGWLNRMSIVSGDSHALAIDTGGGNTWGGFPVYQFGSFDSNGFSVTNQYDTGPTNPGRNHWGSIDVHDCGPGLTVKGTGWVGEEEWRSNTSGEETTGGSLPLTTNLYRCTNTLNKTDATLDVVPGLEFNVEAGYIYYAVLLLSYTGPTTGGLKVDWLRSGGVASNDVKRYVIGLAASTTNNHDSNILMPRRDSDTDQTVGADGGTGSGATSYIEHLVIVPTASGKLSLRAAQATANGTATSVTTSSNLIVTQGMLGV